MDRKEFAAQLSKVAPAIDAALREWALPELLADAPSRSNEGGTGILPVQNEANEGNTGILPVHAAARILHVPPAAADGTHDDNGTEIPPETGSVPNLDEGVRYALGLDVEDPAQRGKRVRPALAVLTCEALGGRREHVMPFAVAVEVMHNFFLVHDDIEDGDPMRHGRPAVWRRFGFAHGVNIGDYLHARVTAVLLRSLDAGLAAETVLRLLTLLVDTLDHTHRGQALDINARSTSDLTVERYFAIVTEKTGHYLAAPMIGGAIVAGAGESLLDALRAFGAAVGPMYQILDDLIDLTEGKGRGESGADVREGKRSFMVAVALARGDQVLRTELLSILDRPRELTTAASVARAIEIFEQCGAVEQARDTIAALAGQARDAVRPLPEPLRRLLLGATDFLENRTR